MASAFAWLNNLIRSFGKLIPRIMLVRATYVAVVFRWNGKAVVRNPGLLWYWPICSHVRMMPTTVRSWNIPTVAVAIEEGPWGIPLSTCVSGIMTARMTNAHKAIEVYHMGAFASAMMTVALSEAYDSLVVNPTDRGKFAIAYCEDEMGKYGYEVLDFRITEETKRVMLGSMYADGPHERSDGDVDSLNWSGGPPA